MVTHMLAVEPLTSTLCICRGTQLEIQPRRYPAHFAPCPAHGHSYWTLLRDCTGRPARRLCELTGAYCSLCGSINLAQSGRFPSEARGSNSNSTGACNILSEEALRLVLHALNPRPDNNSKAQVADSISLQRPCLICRATLYRAGMFRITCPSCSMPGLQRLQHIKGNSVSPRESTEILT